jgi:hypothetical protein
VKECVIWKCACNTVEDIWRIFWKGHTTKTFWLSDLKPCAKVVHRLELAHQMELLSIKRLWKLRAFMGGIFWVTLYNKETRNKDNWKEDYTLVVLTLILCIESSYLRLKLNSSMYTPGDFVGNVRWNRALRFLV